MSKTLLKLPVDTKENTGHIKFPDKGEGSVNADVWKNMKSLKELAENDLLQPRAEAVQEILRKGLS